MTHSPVTPISPLLLDTSPGRLLADWHESGRLREVAPEVDVLFGIPQTATHHPEVDTGVHIGLCLDAAVRLNASDAVKFAVLTHDLGKALTRQSQWPQHIAHEKLGLVPLRTMCARLQVPAYWEKLALLVCEYHLHAHRLFEMNPSSVARLLVSTGMEQDQCLLNDFAIACEADARGRLGKQDRDYPQSLYLRQVGEQLQRVPAVDPAVRSIQEQQMRHRERLAVVTEVKAAVMPPKASTAPAHC